MTQRILTNLLLPVSWFTCSWQKIFCGDNTFPLSFSKISSSENSWKVFQVSKVVWSLAPLISSQHLSLMQIPPFKLFWVLSQLWVEGGNTTGKAFQTFQQKQTTAHISFTRIRTCVHGQKSFFVCEQNFRIRTKFFFFRPTEQLDANYYFSCRDRKERNSRAIAAVFLKTRRNKEKFTFCSSAKHSRRRTQHRHTRMRTYNAGTNAQLTHQATWIPVVDINRLFDLALFCGILEIFFLQLSNEGISPPPIAALAELMRSALENTIICFPAFPHWGCAKNKPSGQRAWEHRPCMKKAFRENTKSRFLFGLLKSWTQAKETKSTSLKHTAAVRLKHNPRDTETLCHWSQLPRFLLVNFLSHNALCWNSKSKSISWRAMMELWPKLGKSIVQKF